MGYSDMKDLEHTNIKYDENQSQYYIEKERNKTGVTFKVFLTENGFFMLQQLIFLTGDDIKPINIPTIDYSLRMYKVIGKKVKIKTNITTYTLRHTFSVDYMEKDGRIEDLQKYLGHSNLKTTQIYGKISKLIIENVLNIIFSQF
jgi:site-specific recombinase XerD